MLLAPLKRNQKKEAKLKVELLRDHQELIVEEELVVEATTNLATEEAEEEVATTNKHQKVASIKYQEVPEEVDIRKEVDTKKEAVTEESLTIQENNKMSSIGATDMREDHMDREPRIRTKSPILRKIWLQEALK